MCYLLLCVTLDEMLLEIVDIRVSHSCACMWSDMMAIVCACAGSDLYVRVPDGFSLNDTSWAISASVRVWKLLVLLITIGIIFTCSRPLLCSCIAYLSGVYIVCMCSMISDMLIYVEYLNSMS
jgi:hypothetical protein